MIRLQKINWLHDTPNQRGPLYIGSMVMDLIEEHNHYYNRKVKDLMLSIKDIYSLRACYSEHDIREGAQSLFDICLKDKSFLKKTIKELLARGELLLNSARKFEDIKDKELSILINFYQDIYQKYVNFFAILLIPELSIDFVEKSFDNELKKQFPSSIEDIKKLLLANEDSFLKKEEKELYDISKQKNFKELLKQHVKKYFWIENNYVDTKYLDENYFLNKLSSIRPQENDDIAKKREFLSSLTDEKYNNLKIYSEIIDFLAFVWDTRKMIIMEFSYYLNNLLKVIGSRKGFNIEQMFLLKPEEIMRIDKIDISEETFLKKKKKVVFYYHNGSYQVFEGEEADKLEGSIAPINLSKEKILYGTPASQGRLIGMVNVLKNIKEMHQLKNGEILVTSNTTPDFVPFLSRAKAIITEKGGITSHAAIVSREMNIPCVVGVKHITSILKKGDLVEINAYEGTVKILKRNKN